MSIRRPSLFGSPVQNIDLFPPSSASSSSTSSGEVDLREEFDELLFGFDSGIRHGHLVVIRHLRRDSTGEPIECSCHDEFTREADPDCSHCLGEAYLWDEKWYWTHSMYSGSDSGLTRRITYMPPGAIRADFRVFFFRYDTPIRYGDKVVEMKLDEEGAVVVPYIRESIYKPQTIQKYRSDNGRVEYIAVHCREDSAIRSDTPE